MGPENKSGTRTSAAAGVRVAFLEERAALLRLIRAFFDGRGFVEVETPVRIPVPALEDYIDAEPADDSYLRTSPELHMKRLLCAGMERIYQMGPCFRRGERGHLHNPEFTMLEWYRSSGDCEVILQDTEALVRHVLAARGTDTRSGVDWQSPWQRLSVSDAFRRWAGWDPIEDFDQERFDLDLINLVEPALPKAKPVVLCDYPKEAAALADVAVRDGRLVAQRWELYAGGMELANAYTELTDAAEQRRRFMDCQALRSREQREVYGLDEPFLAALADGMPPCGGIALGVDRLVMLLVGAKDIAEVRPFARETGS